jgi:hypothetical protein
MRDFVFNRCVTHGSATFAFAYHLITCDEYIAY